MTRESKITQLSLDLLVENYIKLFPFRQFYLDIVKRIVDIAKIQRSDFGIDANIPDDIAEVVFSGPTFDTITEMDWETLFKIYRHGYLVWCQVA